MKKFLALILVICLAVGCLAGCGGKKNNKATKKPTTTTSAPATTAPAASDDVVATDEIVESEEPTEPTEEPLTTDEPLVTEEPTPDEPTTDEPAQDEPVGDWEMPDNSDIDCIDIDFRSGSVSFDQEAEIYDEGYLNIVAGFNDKKSLDVSTVDPDGANPGYINLKVTGEDPFMYLYDLGGVENGAGLYDVSLQDYPIFKIVMKNNTADSFFQIFLFEQGGHVTGNDTIDIRGISSNDTEFKTYYIDLRAKNASNTLTITPSTKLDRDFSAVRFDLPDVDGSFDIQYMGFFSSLDEAKAYK